jgi:DNA-binding winged helix-turn-helix (wHTH) protein
MKATFGPYTLDTGRQQLLADGREVPLSPKALGVLQLLVERRPDVVDKETIVGRVWFGTHVSDASLTMVVAELRKALGDSADQPRYIRTAHRRGYAFCADAQVEPASGAAAEGRRFWLVVGGRAVVLERSETLVGRDPASGIWLDVPSVSWRHARIVVDGRTATIEDLGSTNGTLVNDQPLRGAAVLNDRDRIAFGAVEVAFGASAPKAAARTERLSKRRSSA